MKLDELQERAASFGINLNQDQLHMLDTYAYLLLSWNEKMNLTAIRTYDDVIEKHFFDCLLPLAHMKVAGRTADVGTGAGFPGIVWKIACPDISLHLIEPTGKKCQFLQEVVRQLSLADVEIFNARAEDHVRRYRETYDFVTARAVASLRILTELTLPLVRVSGSFIAMKGARGEEEEEEAANALKKLGASVSYVQKTALPEGDARVNLFIHKDHASPSIYPRSYALIKKKPL